MLAYLPVESVIRVRQTAYYQALAEADKSGNSTAFIEFMLQALQDTLSDALSKTSEKTSEKIIAALIRNSSMTIAELAKSAGVTTRSIERNL
jgi:Fic family protein